MIDTRATQALSKNAIENSNLSVQLLVPIYNEGENVRILYETLLAEGVPFDLMTFVYDLEGDTSLPFIEEIQKRDDRVRALRNTFGRGVIHALRFGFSQAVPGPVIVVMGDNSDKLSIVSDMIELWKQGATVVSPSRYMRGGKQYGGGWLKSNLSRVAGKSLRLIGFPTADPTNNFKLYDGAWLASQRIESKGGFEVALELCFKAYRDGDKIVEIPTEWRDRTLGQSKFRVFSWMPHYLRWYFRAVMEICKKAVRISR